MKRVSRSTLSVPVGPIEGQNPFPTSIKFYCIEDHERNWCPFPRWIALIPPNTSVGRLQSIKSAVGLIFKLTNHLHPPAGTSLQKSAHLAAATHGILLQKASTCETPRANCGAKNYIEAIAKRCMGLPEPTASCNTIVFVVWGT